MRSRRWAYVVTLLAAAMVVWPSTARAGWVAAEAPETNPVIGGNPGTQLDDAGDVAVAGSDVDPNDLGVAYWVRTGTGQSHFSLRLAEYRYPSGWVSVREVMHFPNASSYWPNGVSPITLGTDVALVYYNGVPYVGWGFEAVVPPIDTFGGWAGVHVGISRPSGGSTWTHSYPDPLFNRSLQDLPGAHHTDIRVSIAKGTTVGGSPFLGVAYGDDGGLRGAAPRRVQVRYADALLPSLAAWTVKGYLKSIANVYTAELYDISLAIKDATPWVAYSYSYNAIFPPGGYSGSVVEKYANGTWSATQFPGIGIGGLDLGLAGTTGDVLLATLDTSTVRAKLHANNSWSDYPIVDTATRELGTVKLHGGLPHVSILKSNGAGAYQLTGRKWTGSSWTTWFGSTYGPVADGFRPRWSREGWTSLGMMSTNGKPLLLHID